MTLPNRIKARITTDGIPVPDMFISAKVKMNRKNDYDLAFGPTDEAGEITVSKKEILEEAKKLADLFIMDYVGVESHHAGDVLVTVFDASDIDRAITAYEMFASAGVAYPPNWKEHLRKARAAFSSGLKGLHVEVTFEWPR